MVEVELGTIVWERAPAEADYQARGGPVVDVLPGAVLVAVCGRERGKATIRAQRLEFSQLAEELTQPTNGPKRWALARHICEALGSRSHKAAWSEEELAWLDRAKDLARPLLS